MLSHYGLNAQNRQTGKQPYSWNAPTFKPVKHPKSGERRSVLKYKGGNVVGLEGWLKEEELASLFFLLLSPLKSTLREQNSKLLLQSWNLIWFCLRGK